MWCTVVAMNYCRAQEYDVLITRLMYTKYVSIKGRYYNITFASI